MPNAVRAAARGTDRAAGAHAGGALERALHDVGDRWTLLIVNALLEGPQRFNDLQSGVSGIATNVLAKRLEQLESRSLVVAWAYSNRPPRFAYELTAGGRELAGALRMLRSWGAMYAVGGAGEREHGAEHPACGTALEPRWWCPTCNRVVDDDEGDEDAVHYL
jgi:DNA-binding HxlR family transcriptional regulator